MEKYFPRVVTAKRRLAICLLIGVTSLLIREGKSGAQGTPPLDITRVLMLSTFRISGPTSTSNSLFAAAFILGRPYPGDPVHGRYVLVTAAHVLRAIQGEIATLNFRREARPGEWEIVPYRFAIRRGREPLWKESEDADVAAMYASIPNLSVIRPTSDLADDETLLSMDFHPGDELTCLGYPLGAGGPGDFPILRAGRIASYPLTPTATTKTFLLDFPVFEGNSGARASLANRRRPSVTPS